MTTNEVCPDCQGGGYRDKIPLQNCPTCNGVGWMKAVAGMDALDRLSTPPAVPVTPVAWFYELATAFNVEKNEFYNFERRIAWERPHSRIGSIRSLTPLAAAPVPAHSDVRGSERDSIQEA